MSSCWWTLTSILAAAFLQAKCESTAHPDIPKHLLECYRDNGIYHRANRMPNTLDHFLDLVRKVEESPTSRNLNARELAMVLLHYVKLDGIQSTGSHTEYIPSNTLPFAPSGEEYFKHRVTVLGLVPKIDPSYQAAFNESLTKKEMCNLHFMLSYSIDPYKRPDERCSPLFDDSKIGNEPTSAWDPYQTVGGYYRRYRRHVDHAKNFNGLETGNGKMNASEKSSRKSSTKVSEEKPKKRVSERSVVISKSPTKSDVKWKSDSEESATLSRRKRSVSHGERVKKSEVEEIPVAQHPNAEKKLVHEEKDKFTIGDQELLSAGVLRPWPGMQSLVQTESFGRYGGRAHAKPLESSYAGVAPSAPLSDCPVVNGVVTTPFGSLTVGTVIAGIAAGLNPEEIPPQKFGVDSEDLESRTDRVKNIWGSTLAGTLADMITSSSILDEDRFQILNGGWNDSSDPKWYLLASNQFKHLPEVALRGNLDGLLLGLNAKEWTSKFQGFKLSQMLRIYYGCCWGIVGAKHRLQLRPKYAPEEIFRKQAHLMSLVMKKQKINVLTVLDYNQFSRDAVAKVIQHIQKMGENEKSYIGSFLSTQIDNSIDMIAVIDSSWGHENLMKIFEALRSSQVANVIGSNLTVLCGKDGKTLLTSRSSVDLYNRFTKDMLIDNCTRGMDFPLILDVLDGTYRKIFYDEKISQKMNANAQVAILFPYEPLPRENSFLKEKSENFRSNFPDVRLVVASNGKSESFLDIVKDPKDLYPLVPYSSNHNSKYTKEFAEGMKQSFQRISRPSCGSYFDDKNPEPEIRMTRDVGTGSIAYYRLIPQYFYTQNGQVAITIKSKMTAPLTVCHSRKVERPSPSPRARPDSDYNPNRGSDPEYNFNRSPDYSPDFPSEASPYGRQMMDEPEGQVQCKTITSDPYKIEMNNPCEGASGLRECDPLYISLSPPHQETIKIFCPTCKLPTDVQYEIIASGLTCYNSASVKLLSPFLFSLLLVHCSLKHFY